jgi:hypothetical protein
VERFDIHLDHPKVRLLAPFESYRLPRPPASLADLERSTLTKATARPNEDFHVLAAGIDLSDLGYADGASAAGLFFQDKSGRGLMVDPVFIGGLPAPEAPNVLTAEPKPPPDTTLRDFLADPSACEEIVFAVRVCGFDHWYANFAYAACSVPEYPPQRGLPNERLPRRFGDGGRLCRLNLRSGKLTILLDDPRGGVRDPQVHYDGRKILFAYRKGGQEHYHLHEISIDGGGLRQLTDGPFDDIEPTYLADGSIMFCSSRCNRYVNCWRTPVATLYRLWPEIGGRDTGARHPQALGTPVSRPPISGRVEMISSSIEHDNTPWPLPDGRVLYTRWEYVDRSQVDFHHLWTTNPDGTGQMVFYGNQHPGYAMLDAKPIAGTNRVVASFSPGHGRPGHDGYVTIVDPDAGPDHRGSARRISRELLRDPYALSESWFLAAGRRGVSILSADGRSRGVYRLPARDARLQCHEPRPLRPRPRERTVPDRTDLARRTGRLVLADVYEGRNMVGVRRGEIRKLLVLEQLPKPINFSGGPWPISIGGTFTLARVLGTVPVAPDGSAYFEAPALRSLFFVALDGRDLSVKRMQSFLTVMPGETVGCVGCHERRVLRPAAPRNGRPDPRRGVPAPPGPSAGEPVRAVARNVAALRGAPARIEPIRGAPDVLDFHRDVQPILDRHCVPCHNPDRCDGRVDLCGDHTPLAAQSYWTLLHRGLISDGRNEPFGNRAPRTIGTSASRLMKLIDGAHYEAKPSARERTIVRLWIETSAVYAGTYAALGSGMHPVAFPLEVMERRCGPCHGAEPTGRTIGKGKLYFRFGRKGPYLPLASSFTDLQQVRSRFGYYKFHSARPPQSLCNLTRPEKSLLLRAPLAPRGGGLGRCAPAVFADARDADYGAILARIRAAACRHRREKRFDMAGFRPNVYYVRIMQRYGILPGALGPDEPIDAYATDRAYWRSFWHDPR